MSNDFRKKLISDMRKRAKDVLTLMDEMEAGNTLDSFSSELMLEDLRNTAKYLRKNLHP